MAVPFRAGAILHPKGNTTGAIRTDQADNLTGMNLEIDVSERGDAAEPLRYAGNSQQRPGGWSQGRCS